MKTTVKLIAVIALAAAILAAGYWWGNTQSGPSAANPPKTSVPDRKILYYRNPMGHPDTSPVPKKDSMGMDYLPVYGVKRLHPMW